jgi:hypothetical protein
MDAEGAEGVDTGQPQDGGKPPAGDRAYLLLLLRLEGVPAAGVNRLVALRRTWRDRDPSLDGYAPDRRTTFARWLYLRGRIAG